MMNSVRKNAIAMLESHDFFSHVRAGLTRTGIIGEQSTAVLVFVVAVSRFLRNPLRLCIKEKTVGAVPYILKKVSMLLERNTIGTTISDRGWSAFARNPSHKVVFIPEWSDWAGTAGGARLEVAENSLTRWVPDKADGIILDRSEQIEAPFSCISARYQPDVTNRSRWLTIYQRRIPWTAVNQSGPLTSEESESWHQVQQLLHLRADIPFCLPYWTDVIIEAAANDPRSSVNIPAFLQTWKTMRLIRSFYRQKSEPMRLRPDFADFAETAFLLKKLCWEWRRFPSPTKLLSKIPELNQRTYCINPLTGKGVRYERSEGNHNRSYGKLV